MSKQIDDGCLAVSHRIPKPPEGRFYCGLKPFEGFIDRSPFYPKAATFAEDYRSGNLSLVLVFRTIGIPNIFPIDDRDSFIVAVISANGDHVRDLHLRDENLVFVSNVELMESVDEVSNRIASLVRLYRIEKFVADSGDGLLLFSAFDKRFKMFSAGVDREEIFVERDYAIRLRSFMPSKVECGSEIMNRISANESASFDDFRNGEYFLNQISTIRIDDMGCHIGRESLVGKSFNEIGIELVDVLSGPFDL